MIFEEILARDGRLVYRTRGVSMKPMLYQNRDLVCIKVPEGPLKNMMSRFISGGRVMFCIGLLV